MNNLSIFNLFLKRSFRWLMLLIPATFGTTSALASGPQVFPDIRSLMGAPYYRITCSHTDREVQTHVVVSVNEGWVKEFKVYLIAPSESVQTIEAYGSDLSGFYASLGFTQLDIKGDWPGAYLNQQMSLRIRDGQHGMEGHFEYDDGDGFETSLDMNCGAVNYIRFG